MKDIGPKKRKSALEKSVDNWIAINITGNGSVVGYLKEVNGREMTLNPYRAWRYNAEQDCNLYKIVKEDAYVEVSPNGYFLELTNRETIDYSIRELNENIINEKKKKDSKEKNN